MSQKPEELLPGQLPAATIQQIAKMATANLQPIQLTNRESIPYAVVPDGYEVVSLEKQIFHNERVRPSRIRKTSPELASVPSFVEYVNRFKTEGTLIVYSEAHQLFKAILDYHQHSEMPAWCEHEVSLRLKNTIAASVWIAQNRKSLNQAAFAEFIEDNAADLVDAAGMIEVSRSLQATKKVEFTSDIRLDNGQVQLKYNETINGSTQQGSREIPETFDILLPLFPGEAPSNLKARLRYRIENGQLLMWYVLVDLQRHLQNRIESAIEVISKQTEVKVLRGA